MCAREILAANVKSSLERSRRKHQPLRQGPSKGILPVGEDRLQSGVGVKGDDMNSIDMDDWLTFQDAIEAQEYTELDDNWNSNDWQDEYMDLT
jgi:hypothetical protein